MALALFDDDKRGRDAATTLRHTMDTRDVLTQPSLWLDEDITAALRRAMESQRLGGAESLIRGEVIRFMQKQRSAEQRSKWDMIVVERNEEIPQSDSSSSEPPPSEPETQPEPESSSSGPPPSVPSRNIIEEIMMKYGLERQNHPPIVIAKPIPPPEPTSAPPPSAVKTRKKAFARKGANKGTTSTESAESEQEIPSVQAEQEIPTVQAIPILKEVKLEIEEMTPEEFERYGYTDKISFGEMARLDAERAKGNPTQPIGKGKRKA